MPQVIHSNKSQCAKILRHIKQYGSISPLDALRKYGCMRLGARVYELKSEGYKIKADIVYNTKGKRFAVYYLKSIDSLKNKT